MKKVILLLGLISTLMLSCEVKPEPINYGEDACVFCKMTIVDQQHAAQLVTKKGKAFKYDAVECMLNYMSEHNQDMAFYLVADYANPGQLTNAENATYLISEGIKSPMGANLTAFESKIKASETTKELGGNMYNWSEIKAKFEVK